MDFSTLVFKIDAIAKFQTLGFTLMAGVFILVLVRRVMVFLESGDSNFLTPLLHVALGLLAIKYLPILGAVLLQVTEGISRALYADQNLTDFFTTEYQGTGLDTYDAQKWSVNLWSFDLMHFFARVAVFGMLVVKLVLIDIVWQLFFALSVLLGPLVIPLTLAFGGDGVKTWLRTLIELMLWPIIYSLLMLLMHSVVMHPQGFFRQDSVIEEDLKRIAACLAITLLTMLTPFFARQCMSGVVVATDLYKTYLGSLAAAVATTSALAGSVSAAVTRGVMTAGRGNWESGGKTYRSKHAARHRLDKRP